MNEKLNNSQYKIVKSLDKGLSGDKRYYIETVSGKQLYMRVNDVSEYERMKTIFGLMKRVVELNIPMIHPVEMGLCEDGKSVYQLLTWCNGDKVEDALLEMSKTDQYTLGIRVGEILRKIHSIPALGSLEDWSSRYCKEVEKRLTGFRKCSVQISGSESIFQYYENNKHLLIGRPQCLHHGDFHNANLLITNNNELSVIDWQLLDFDNFADPWEEFNRMNHSKLHPYFASGQIQGYFKGEPPAEFWQLFALYLSVGALLLVSWAYYYQKDELEYTVRNANDVVRWFDNMSNPMPSWYIKRPIKV